MRITFIFEVLKKLKEQNSITFKKHVNCLFKFSKFFAEDTTDIVKYTKEIYTSIVILS